APRRRRALGTRGRAALLWGAAVFALVQVALAVAIESRYPHLRDPYYGYKEERFLPRLAAMPVQPRTVVMLGSSRTSNGLCGQEVERLLAGPDGKPVVFNFGLPGSGPLTHLLTFRRLLARGVTPDLLLIEVMPAFLAGQVPVPEVEQMAAHRL